MIVGLDIGTCFIRTVIAELDDYDKIEVIGVSKVPSQGLRNGVIVNIDNTLKAVKQSIENAEQIAGIEVDTVFVSIGGSQIESFSSKGQVAISEKPRSNRMSEVSKNSKLRVLESSRAVALPLDKQLIHQIPQTYFIDDIEYRNDIIGQQGVRLEVNSFLITASNTVIQNIRDCVVNRGGLALGQITLKTLAASYAVLHDEEKELGSVLIDLGGGTTDIIILNNGAPVFTTSISAGGNRVTGDIAAYMGLSIPQAEKLKIEHGTCWLFGGEENEEIIIPGLGTLPPERITKYDLYEVVSARMEEILTAARKEVVRLAKLTKLNGSIVLTGGGALMPGILELAQSVWKTSSVRIGMSADFGGTDDSYREADYATVMGLIIANKASVEPLFPHKTAKKAEAEQGKHPVRDFFRKFI